MPNGPRSPRTCCTPARDVAGRNPYRWLAEALPGTGRVLDLGCGTAPLAEEVGLHRYAALRLALGARGLDYPIRRLVFARAG